MSFLDRWAVQFDSFMGHVLPALAAGIVVACFSPKFMPRFLIGSIFLGVMFGAGAAGMGWPTGIVILITIAGVITAPVTVAAMSRMTIWDALEKLLSMKPRP